MHRSQGTDPFAENGLWTIIGRRIGFHFHEDKSIMTTINEQDVRSETIRVRRAAERAHARYDWLDTWHTFSFNTYYDPAYMGFRALRVINEDRVQPGTGFGMHGHRDMEIITYVLEGALEHRDSLGTGSVLRPGEFQRMSAGTGIRHSEFNPSNTEPVHLYQIWLLPNEKGLQPSYEQKSFSEAVRQGRLRLVASPDAQDGSLLIHQDARVCLSTLDADQEVRHDLQPGRHAWLQVLRGAVELNGQSLATSDGAAVSDETVLSIRANAPSEVLLFDLA
jgi:quercetin 2,3-dioxygenase